MRPRLLGFLLVLLAISPVAAFAQTPARCGFSFGLTGAIGVPTANEIRTEFPYFGGADGEVKYYLWKPFSLAASVGFLYGEGKPEKEEYHESWINLDRPGHSFFRAGVADALLRIEIGRYWRFNPYVGGGAGYMYSTLERRGVLNKTPVTDSYDEWIFHYLALVGYDFMFDKYVGLKMEGRWTFAQSRDNFADNMDLGAWLGLIGVQIYL